MSEAETVNIPDLMAELTRLHEVTNNSGLSILELALGKEGAQKALRGITEAYKKQLNPSVLPWRNDVAEAQEPASVIKTS